MRTNYLNLLVLSISLLVAGCNATLNGAGSTISSSSGGSGGSSTSACTDDALNPGSCTTSANRYVTPTLGSNLVGSNGSLSDTVPAGFYDGSTTCSMTDSNLIPGNIVSGTTIFGVTGTAAIPACKTGQLPYSYGTLAGYSCCGYSSGITGDGTYIYVGENGMAGTNMLLAFAFDTTTHAWTLKSGDTTYTAGNVVSMWDDGTYVYTCEGTTGLEAWSFNGSAWTNKASYSTSMSCNQIWGDGTYLYVADGTNGLKAFSFNGSAFSLLADYGTADVPGISVNSVWGNSHGIYISDSGNNVLRALSYGGGASFTAGGTVTGVSANVSGGITSDGTYIYVGDGTGELYAYTYNGSTFSLVGHYSSGNTNDPQLLYASAANPGHVYVENFGTATWVWGFNGTAFSYEGIVPNQVNNLASMWTDGTYLYFNDYSNQIDDLYVSAWPLCN